MFQCLFYNYLFPFSGLESSTFWEMKILFSWDVTLSRLVTCYQRFEWSLNFNLPGRSEFSAAPLETPEVSLTDDIPNLNNSCIPRLISSNFALIFARENSDRVLEMFLFQIYFYFFKIALVWNCITLFGKCLFCIAVLCTVSSTDNLYFSYYEVRRTPFSSSTMHQGCQHKTIIIGYQLCAPFPLSVSV